MDFQPQDSRFSNIEELDAENDTESEQHTSPLKQRPIVVENLDSNNDISNLEAEGTETGIVLSASKTLNLKAAKSDQLDKLIIRDATEDEEE